jgi:hypothetical protein
VILRRLAPLVAAAALLGAAGCGGGAGARDATLWVTRDRGAQALRAEKVRSGLTAAQALESAAKVQTRYSGEFIEGIDGLAGGGNRDWFIYVNGYALDRSAADYVLRPGDVEWWDFRNWDDPGEAPLVAGAFPEPFVHGLAGKVRVAVVRYAPGTRGQALALAAVVGARSVAREGIAVPDGANVLVVERGSPHLRIRYRAGHGTAGDPVEVDVAGDPGRYAHRYGGP